MKRKQTIDYIVVPYLAANVDDRGAFSDFGAIRCPEVFRGPSRRAAEAAARRAARGKSVTLTVETIDVKGGRGTYSYRPEIKMVHLYRDVRESIDLPEKIAVFRLRYNPGTNRDEMEVEGGA